MIRQTVLPFKLKSTEERITARSGLVLYGEFFRAMYKEKGSALEKGHKTIARRRGQPLKKDK